MNGMRMLCMTGLALLVSGTAQAAGPGPERSRQPQVEYSADSYMETEEITLKSKVFHAPGKERKEQEMGGEQQVMIIRQDKQVIWTVMPSQQMYMEMNLQGNQRPPGDDPSGYQFEKTEVGPDVIDGVQTTKYKVIATKQNGEKMGGFMWVTRDGIQMKMDLIALVDGSKSRMKTGLTNLKIGKQSASLFEVPSGYTKMTMPSFGGHGGPAGATGRMPTTQMPPTQRPNMPTQEEVTDEAAAETQNAGDAVKKGMEDEGINRLKGLFGR